MDKLNYFDRQVWTLFVAEVINVMGTSLVNTFLSLYMYNTLGISMTQIGIALFISAIAGAAAAYLGGSLADTVGRKKVLIGGLAAQVIVFLLISYAIDQRIPFMWLIAVLTLNALVGSLYRAVPEVMVADVVEPGKRVESYGLLRVGANLGWVIGPSFGGLLIVLFSLAYSSMFLVTTCTTFAYLLIAIFLLKDTMPATQAKEKLRISDIKDIVKDSPFLLFCLISMLMLVPYQQMYTLLTVYSSAYVHLNDFWVGMLYTESGIMVVLFQFWVSSRVKNYRMTVALAVCALVFAGGFLLLVPTTFILIPFVAIAVMTVAEMIWAPASSTLQANMSPENKRGRYFGFNGLMGSIGYSLGPLFGGFLKDSVNDSNITLMWAVVASLFLVCCAGYLLLGRIMPVGMNRGTGEVKEKKVEMPVEA